MAAKNRHHPPQHKAECFHCVASPVLLCWPWAPCAPWPPASSMTIVPSKDANCLRMAGSSFDSASRHACCNILGHIFRNACLMQHRRIFQAIAAATGEWTICLPPCGAAHGHPFHPGASPLRQNRRRHGHRLHRERVFRRIKLRLHHMGDVFGRIMSPDPVEYPQDQRPGSKVSASIICFIMASMIHRGGRLQPLRSRIPTVPAFSNVSDPLKCVPTSGCFGICMNMMCNDFGFSSTVFPAGSECRREPRTSSSHRHPFSCREVAPSAQFLPWPSPACRPAVHCW